MRDLETRMDTIFGDAFRNAGDWFNRSSMASSVDVREQNNKYVARVYLPHFDTSKAKVNIENGVLHIVANGKSSVNGKAEAEHYEQSISLPKPVQSEKMQVQRKPDLLVITVPEQMAGSQTAALSTVSPSPETSPASAADEWEGSISNAFARLDAAMNRALNETFPDNFAIGPQASQLESAVKMDDQKNKYVVHFYLPEKNVSDVHVNFENGKLQLTAKEEHSATPQPGGGSAEFSGEYSATISVPGSVNKDEMKVARQANAIVVTLPKA
jgi:HSP20 family molecular chaperone IbpA